MGIDTDLASQLEYYWELQLAEYLSGDEDDIFDEDDVYDKEDI